MIVTNAKAKRVAIVEFVVLGIFVILLPTILFLSKFPDTQTDVTIIIPAEPLARISNELLAEHMKEILEALDWDVGKSKYFESDFNEWNRPAREGFIRDLQEIVNRHHLPLKSSEAEKAFNSGSKTELSRSEQMKLIAKLINSLAGHNSVPVLKDYTNVLELHTHKTTRIWILQGLLHEFKRRKTFVRPNKHRHKVAKVKSWSEAQIKDLRSETVEVIEKLEWNPSEQFMDAVQADWQRSVREEFLLYATEILAHRDEEVHPISAEILDVGPKGYELGVIRALLIVLIDKDPSSEFNSELDHFTAVKPREELFQHLRSEYYKRSKLTEDGTAAKRMVNRMIDDQNRAYWDQGAHSWIHVMLDYGNAGNTTAEIIVILLRLGCLIGLNVILYFSIVWHGAGKSIIWAMLHGGVTIKILSHAITKIWMGAPVYYIIIPISVYIIYRLVIFYLITEFIFGDEKIMTTLRSAAVNRQKRKLQYGRGRSGVTSESERPEQIPASASV